MKTLQRLLLLIVVLSGVAIAQKDSCAYCLNSFCYNHQSTGYCVCIPEVICEGDTCAPFCYTSGACLGLKCSGSAYPAGDESVSHFPWLGDESIPAAIGKASNIWNVEGIMRHIQMQQLIHGADVGQGSLGKPDDTVHLIWKVTLTDDAEIVTFWSGLKADGKVYSSPQDFEDAHAEPIEIFTFTKTAWSSSRGPSGKVAEFKSAAQLKAECEVSHKTNKL
jgi:hypothetical protein